MQTSSSVPVPEVSTSVQPTPFSKTIIVGVVLGVLLLLLITGGVVTLAAFKWRRRLHRKQNHNTEIPGGLSNSEVTPLDYHNQETHFGNQNDHEYPLSFRTLPRTPVGIHDLPQIPSNIPNTESSTLISSIPLEGLEAKGKGNFSPEDMEESKSVMYEDIPAVLEPAESQYSTIDIYIQEENEAHVELPATDGDTATVKKAKGKKGYSLVRKKRPPVVPGKSPELHQALLTENATKILHRGIGKGLPIGLCEGEEGINPMYVSSDSLFSPPRVADNASTYSVINENCTSKLATTNLATPMNFSSPLFFGSYSEIQRESELSEDEDYTDMKGNVRADVPKLQVSSGPVVLNTAICKSLEENPQYQSTDSLMMAMEVHNKKGKFSAAHSGSIDFENSIKATHSKAAESLKKRDSNDKASTTIMVPASDDSGPIYSSISSFDESELRAIFEFRPENVRKVRTLGTGFFGKVILAETVGLSLKDLSLSETDDDKQKPVRVAVKQLRTNPSPDRREAFYKELKFMSQLDHPNVIRTLGACTVGTPFIVMEYMEKGDLNQYLQDFDAILEGNSSPTNLTISVGILTYMSAQIADAMKYLASRNYIHRDLATRNCLVGDESRIKIADFGMSKNLYRSHYYFMSAHAILPIRWMAKECFYGKFSAKTDVWAFGVTMWEMFTLGKEIPYEDMDDSEVVADASDEGNRQLLKRPTDCPKEIYETMLMCWREEPKNRASFDKLHETLCSIVNAQN